jgi:valine--pyruvate aminotransferase
MNYSAFGEKLGSNASVVDMMDNLSNALHCNSDITMLGGGNPAFIKEIGYLINKHILPEIAKDDTLYKIISNYSSPKGDSNTASLVANYLQEYCEWNVTSDSILFCNGSQSALFMIANLLSGRQKGKTYKKILLPFTPEYIGYEDLFVDGDCIQGNRPMITLLGENSFEYSIDYKAIEDNDTISCMLVSSPSNPSGKVISQSELKVLLSRCKSMNIPLIYDNAYGWPFPNIQFNDERLRLDEDMIITMSLSKAGMPGLRAGIVIAKPEFIDKLRCVNAITQLSPNTMSMFIIEKLIETRLINTISNELIRPFYMKRAETIVQILEDGFKGYPIRMHKSMGTMFIWIWGDGLSITSQRLYERLKRKGILTLSGHHFFLGNKNNNWKHKDECLRITYSQNYKIIEKALKIIIEEFKCAMD